MTTSTKKLTVEFCGAVTHAAERLPKLRKAREGISEPSEYYLTSSKPGHYFGFNLTLTQTQRILDDLITEDANLLQALGADL